jgi:hypothetical protein
MESRSCVLDWIATGLSEALRQTPRRPLIFLVAAQPRERLLVGRLELLERRDEFCLRIGSRQRAAELPTAQQVASNLGEAVKGHEIELDDVVIVERDGKVKLHQPSLGGLGAASGALWGGLIGLMGIRFVSGDEYA